MDAAGTLREREKKKILASERSNTVCYRERERRIRTESKSREVGLLCGSLLRHFATKSLNSSDHADGFDTVGEGRSPVAIMNSACSQTSRKKKTKAYRLFLYRAMNNKDELSWGGNRSKAVSGLPFLRPVR